MQLDFFNIELQLKHENGKTLVFDTIRKNWFVLTPEEHVRQYVLRYFMDVMNYPKGMIAVEKTIVSGNMRKRFDIVVYERNGHTPWLLTECKAPVVDISDATLNQLLSYQRTVQCNYWLLTNGRQSFCADACNRENVLWVDALPAYDL